MIRHNDKSIFIETLKLGEKTTGLFFTDYEDAFLFSEKYYSDTSKQFIEHFIHHSDEPKGSYEKDVIRYNYIKAVEHRISSDLYSNTSRGNVCDVLRSPFDIHLALYPTNLPKHLERIINGFQNDAERIANEIVARILPMVDDNITYQILNAVQFLGQAYGYHVGQDNMTYKAYKCCEMLTRDEISNAAGSNLCRWLEQNNHEINGVCFTREPCLSIMTTYEGNRRFIVFSAEIAPEDPGFIKEDLDEAFSIAEQYNATPYYACVNIGSSDNRHFSDGVILAGDGMKFMVRAFGVLEVEE